MPEPLTLALDAMGGDHAPEMVVKGADIAVERHPGLKIQLYGREPEIQRFLKKAKRLRQSVEIVHTDDVVPGDMKPSVALRKGRQSSMRLAINAVSDGRADAIVSAGNTGALMAMSKFVLRSMPGIDRPAIASYFPSQRGEIVMLDLGANVDCNADNLVQFALMGDVMARSVLGIIDPTVGLLNVGEEEQKGSETLRTAAERLRSGKVPVDFYGFVEGDDLAKGTVDVIVSDGFSGNIALKTAEGTSRLIAEFLKDSFKASLMAKLGYLFARPAIKRLRRRMDPRRYNGAVLVGLNGISVKSHGGTDAIGFANAIGVAVDLCRHGFIDRIGDELAKMNPAALAAKDPATGPLTG
ncbi:MAG: phosphate acyltransferase PlsX [Alphaproteobacteria bacterium]|nr:phosphate acyltransferase PlsX [Alphaproteobacteria bacterium]